MKTTLLGLLAASTLLASCEPVGETERPAANPQDVYFERLSLLCGKAYPGALVSEDPQDADMAGQPMVMYVARCDQNEIQIPFHVGQNSGSWNRSRTWIITRTPEGLRLKHKHRHEDGSLDKVTNYGGDTADQGSEERQEFPVDAESIALFETEGLDVSVTNVWAVEISPPGQNDAHFSYELRRLESSDNRRFKVRFDLSAPIPAPPPAWGDEANQPGS